MSKYQKIVDLRNMYLIKKSGYFDDKYYRLEYPEVTGNRLSHYYHEGYKKGYNPSSKFDNDFYLTNNTDVYNASINPLLHYIISGKNEGRQIKKVSGIKISTLYSMLKHDKHSFRSFLSDESYDRLTIFLMDNKYLDVLFNLLKRVLNIKIRIMYNDIDFNKIDMYIKNNSIDMSNIEFVKWNNHYYFNVLKNEKIICFDYYVLNALLNTLYVNKPIYYYVDKNLDVDSNDYRWLSYYVSQKQVVLIGNDSLKLSNYNLIVQNKSLEINKDTVKIDFCFNELCIPLLQEIEKYFINHVFDYELEFYYNANDFCKTLCFIDERRILYTPSIEDMDVIVRFNYDKKDFKNLDRQVSIYFEKSDDFLTVLNIDLFCDRVGGKHV